MHTTREALIQFIIDRLTDLSLTPRGVSKLLGKSPTYMADFIGTKASPKKLDEETRADLARILETSEENLKFQPQKIKESVGLMTNNVSAANIEGRAKRATGMNMRDIYLELGMLKQRVAQLEADREVMSKGSRSHPPRGRRT
jgi:hypothetical protein